MQATSRRELTNKALEALESRTPPTRGARVLVVRYNKQAGSWGAGTWAEIVRHALWAGIGFTTGAALSYTQLRHGVPLLIALAITACSLAGVIIWGLRD